MLVVPASSMTPTPYTILFSRDPCVLKYRFDEHELCGYYVTTVCIRFFTFLRKKTQKQPDAWHTDVYRSACLLPGKLFSYFLASRLDVFLNLQSEISFLAPFSETVQIDDTNFGSFPFYSVAK